MKTNEIYEMITERITRELKKGKVPWLKPWTGSAGALSRQTGKPYSWLNQLAMPAGEYATFNQIKKEGGKVNKGAKSYPIVFWKLYTKEVENAEGETEEKTIPVLRYYRVFNIEEDTDLEPKRTVENIETAHTIDELERVKNGYINKYNIGFTEEEGDRAFYVPALDSVTVPKMEQFPKTAEYYSTVFHELAHSTGHKSRLNRLNMTAHFGTCDYSREELVAELTACGIMHEMGEETSSSFRNSTAYIQSWLKALENDSKMIVWASGRAEKAFDMIMSSAEPAEDKPAKKAEKKAKKAVKATKTDINIIKRIVNKNNSNVHLAVSQGTSTIYSDGFTAIKPRPSFIRKAEGIEPVKPEDEKAMYKKLHEFIETAKNNNKTTVPVKIADIKEFIKAKGLTRSKKPLPFKVTKDVYVNPFYLMDVLTVLKADAVMIDDKKTRPIFVKNADTGEAIVMPIRK